MGYRPSLKQLEAYEKRINSSELVKPDATVVSNSTEQKPAAVNNQKKDWLTTVQPTLDKLKGADGKPLDFTYQDYGYLMRAYSGRYDQILNDDEANPELKKAIQKLQKGAYSVGAGIKARDNKLFETGLKEAQNNWELIQELTNNKQSRYKISNDGNFRLLKQEQFDIEDENPRVKVDKQGNPLKTYKASDKEGNPNRDISWAYFDLKGYDDNWQKGLRKEVSTVVADWSKKSLAYATSSSKNADEKKRAYDYNLQILSHVAKYGDANKENKEVSQRIINKLAKVKTLDEKLNIIKEERKSMANISENLGYYGSMNIFSQYKNNFSKDARYYHKDLDVIETSIKDYDDFKKSKNLISADVARDLIVKNKYYKSLFKVEGEGEDAVYKVKSFTEFSNAVTKDIRNKKMAEAYQKGGNWAAGGNNIDVETKEAVANMYKEMTKNYRLGYNKVDMKKIKGLEHTAYAFNMGNEETMLTEYVGVDMTLDKDKKYVVKAGGNSPKHNYAQSVLDMIFNENGEIDGDIRAELHSKGNFTKSKVDISAGKEDRGGFLDTLASFGPAYEDDEKTSDDAEKAYKTFFSKPRKDVAVTFLKNVGNKDYSSYVIRDRKTNEVLQLYVPKSKAKNDPFYKAAAIDRHENTFRMKGEKVLPEFNDKDANGNTAIIGRPRIEYNPKTQIKELVLFINGNDENGTAIEKEKRVFLGYNSTLNIKDAEVKAQEVIDDYLNQLKTINF
ncbi:MAG: hypothetical protein RIR01_2401 [Bacteroidota bacterium]|jgi:hypothetical protein